MLQSQVALYGLKIEDHETGRLRLRRVSQASDIVSATLVSEMEI